MPDETNIPNALTAKEWAEVRAIQGDDNEDGDWMLARFRHAADRGTLPEAMALANAALPDGDPRKITRKMADAVARAGTPFAGDPWRGLDGEARERAIQEWANTVMAAAAALYVILPPEGA